MIDKFKRGGITYYRFQTTSNGTKGCDWIPCLEQMGKFITPSAKRFLTSELFMETSGVTTEIVVPKTLFPGDPRMVICIEEIWNRAIEQNLKPLSVENICLILMTLTDADLLQMGVNWVIGMSKLVGIPPTMLGAGRNYNGPPRLAVFGADPKDRLRRTDGCAFAL